MIFKKKVLFFTPSVVGGAERVTLTIAKMLPVEEYDVKIVYVCNAIGDLKDFVPDRIPTRHVKVRNIWDFTTWRMYRLIKEEKPYAVFTSLGYLWGRLLIASHFANPKIINILRSNIGYERWGSKINKVLATLTLRWANVIVMQTKEMLDGFKNAMPQYADKMIVLANPIDFDLIKNLLKEDGNNPFDANRINYVSTCRLSPEKRIEDLLMAFSKVHKMNKNTKLTCLGFVDETNAYMQSLLAIVKKEGLEDCVDFVGLQKNSYKFIKHADCFVLPSAVEGFPNTLLETLYLRTPAVATKSVPVVEQLLTKDRGFAIEVGNVEAMADCMVKALEIKDIPPFEYNSNEHFVKLFE